MRIVTWNCNGRFREKYSNISKFNADIYVIQECENPIESKSQEYINWANNYLWIGDSKNKGLAIFAKKELKIEKLSWSNTYLDHTVKHFLPCKLNNEFDLLAIWTHRNNSPNFGYIGQLWKYLQINKNNIKDSILVGDFNSNKRWDQWDRWWNHSNVVEILLELQVESIYHKLKREEQGEETQPTLYFQKNISKQYHIDYIFGASKFLENAKKIEIGKYIDWIELSDHMPIICDIEY